MPLQRKPNCGICGSAKVERRGRQVCPQCNRRYARDYNARRGPEPSTPARRAVKARYRNKKRASGLTNQKVNSLRKLYGMTEQEYIGLLQKQQGRCAICAQQLREVLVDHSHKTGRIRGLLCRRCNFGIGLFNDDRVRLLSAAEYIEHHALEDARWTKQAYEFLIQLKESRQ